MVFTAQAYPYSWHVLSLLCLLPWRQDLFSALPMLFACAWLGLSVYLLNRYGGTARFYAVAAGNPAKVNTYRFNPQEITQHEQALLLALHEPIT